jgi:cytidine deaminase
VCAERNAVAATLVAGTRPAAVAVIVNGKTVAPCGACRQVLAEFDPAMPIVLASTTHDSHEVMSLDALLPGAFRFEKP